ncbi:MAG: hypothetical protein RLZ98_2386 [Pseudomonadota bacterium]
MNGRIALGATVAAVLLGANPAAADKIEELYKGKTMSLIVSAGSGGGYASYARAFTPVYEKHIPGKPNIIIKHMPGGGGIRASNYLDEVAPKDGLTIGFIHSSVPFAPLYGIKGAKFDPRKFNWLGSISTASGICVAWHTAKVNNWQDVVDGKLVVGGTGAGSQMETLPAMVNKLFGAKIKIISGYKGGNDVYLAMERGEVNGRCGGLISSIKSTRPDWFPDKKVTVPFQIATKRHPMFPDAVSIFELAKDDKTKNIVKLITYPFEMDRPFLAPPGVPDDVVAALRKAFLAAGKDKEFQAVAEKQQLEVDPVPGEEVARMIKEAYAMPKEIVAEAAAAMRLTGGSK